MVKTANQASFRSAPDDETPFRNAPDEGVLLK